MRDFVPLNEVIGAVIIKGRLTIYVECCLKGCKIVAGTRKFDSMIGQYEIKCHPHDVTGDMENVTHLKSCDKN